MLLAQHVNAEARLHMQAPERLICMLKRLNCYACGSTSRRVSAERQSSRHLMVSFAVLSCSAPSNYCFEVYSAHAGGLDYGTHPLCIGASFSLCMTSASW